MKIVCLILIYFGSAIPAFADQGKVVKEDICGTGNTLIETTEGLYVVAEHDSGVYLHEGNVVFGILKTTGLQKITRSDGESGLFYIEEYGSEIDDVFEELCD